MSEPRTKIDWSKHEIIIEDHPEAKQIVHYFKRPDTIMQSVKFINTHGILAVTGDYGNWIFCRSFVPSAESDFVSDGYWIEKLQIASEQVIYKFDVEATEKALYRAIDEIPENFDKDSDKEDALVYYQNCLDVVEDGEFHYRQAAADNLPPGWDYESIILEEKPPIWLLCVFDAYDEMVRRMKDEKSKTQ
jgi:hypothetical protein